MNLDDLFKSLYKLNKQRARESNRLGLPDGYIHFFVPAKRANALTKLLGELGIEVKKLSPKRHRAVPHRVKRKARAAR